MSHPAQASATADSRSQRTQNTRIAVTMTIVTLLIFAVVALVFYEHGKRVASRNQDHESGIVSGFQDVDRGNGSDGLQLFEGFHSDDLKPGNVVQSTCASFKSCDLNGDVQEEVFGPRTKEEEAKRKKVRSLRSIYELG